MKSYKFLISFLFIALLGTNYTLEANTPETPFSKIKEDLSNHFNPFELSLGNTTESEFAGIANFFGETTDAVWGGTSNVPGAIDGNFSNSFIFPNKQSRFLYVRDFNMNIPCNASITDITFNVTRQNGSDVDATDVQVRVFDPTTLSFGAANLADPNVFIEGGAWETIAYSDPTWGANLTPEIINSSRFGLILQIQHGGTSGVAEPRIDAVELVVCYDVVNPVMDPITVTADKTDACFDEGSIVVFAEGGTGSYEYSINDGLDWQSSNVFSNLTYGDYIVTVRNDDGSCQTGRFYCNIGADNRIAKPGDALVACSTQNTGSSVTLAIEKTQPFNDFYNQGLVGTDVSPLLPVHPNEWTTGQLCGEVFSASLDQFGNIYTASTKLYRMAPGNLVPAVISKIDGVTGQVTKITTLEGDHGIAGVEYDTLCNQIYTANLEDGIIYRTDPNTGAILSSFDPLTPDDGVSGLVELGERVIAVTYNYNDNRLYYSMWNSDFNQTGIRNTIRSVAIDPNTCDFLPATDIMEFELPWTTEYGDMTATADFSMPVGDIEFSNDGMSMLLAEVGFNSSTSSNAWKAHEARILEYNGTTTTWALNTNIPATNEESRFEIGEVNNGLNARGGVDFANAGFGADDCAIDDETFIIATADALRGSDCNSLGCIYGLQYFLRDGDNAPVNSVLLDIGRNLDAQLKSVFGDVDMIPGCREPIYCASYDLALNKTLTSTGTITPGSTITFQIVVENEGGFDANNISFVDNAPAGLTYDSSDAGPNANVTEATPGNFTITQLLVGASETVNVTYTVDTDFMGTSLTNTAQITADDGDDFDSDPDVDENTDDLNDGRPDDDESSVTFTIEQIYDLDLVITEASTGPYAPGSAVTYQIVVGNDGTLDASGVQVITTPEAGLTFMSSDATTNPNVIEVSPGVWTINSLNTGDTEVINVTYTIDNTFMGTSLTTVGQITVDDGNDIDSDPDQDETVDDLADGIADDDEGDVTVTVTQSYDLALSQDVVTAGPYMQGSNVTFQITLTNEGTVQANNVEITDFPPGGLIYVSSDEMTNANVTETSPGVFVVSSINPGDTEVINITYQIDPTFMGTSLTNLAQITADDGDDVDSDPDVDETVDDLNDGIADDDETAETINVGQVYDLSLVKSVASMGPYMQGSDVTFTIVVSNDGTIAANNTQVTDAAPAGLTYVDSDAGTNANVTETTNGVFEIASIAASGSETINVTYQIDPTFMGTTITNVAQITADDGDDVDSDPDSDNTVDDLNDGIADDDEDESMVMVGQVYDLALDKAIVTSGPYFPGSNITYEFTISNEGTLNASNVEFTDSPDAGLVFISSNAPSNANVMETSTGVWVIGNLPAMSSESIQVIYQVSPTFMGASLNNVGQITGDDGDDVDSDPDSDENEDDLNDGVEDDDEDTDNEIQIDQVYDLAISKTAASAGPFSAGDNITFLITVSNQGSLNAANIEVTDTPQANLTFVSSNATSNANINEVSPGVWEVVSLSALSQEVIEATYQIDPNFTGVSIGNDVAITGDDGDDIDSDPNSDNTVDDLGDGIDDDDEDGTIVDVNQVYDLSLSKTVTSSGPYMLNSTVSYSLAVTNEGTLPAGNIEVTDMPTSALVFQSDDSGTNPNVISTGPGVYQFTSIAAGATETVNLTFTIDPSYAGGAVGNVGQITADDGDDQDSDPDSGTDQDDFGDGLEDDDEDEAFVDVLVNGSIGDFVWEDTNGNGIQDGGEQGVANVELVLFNSNGFEVSRVFTDNSGFYLFDDVRPGNYYISIVYPESRTATLPNQGGDDTVDSDLDNSNGLGTTSIVNLGPGEMERSLDLGIIECIPVGDFVWFDYNQNDVADFFENGINGIRVELYRQENGSWILWDVTYTGHKPDTPSDDGYYKFCVMPGNYYLRFVNPPDQLVPVVPNVGGNELTDSEVTGMFGSGTTNDFTVTSGQERCDIGAGFYPMGTIGDYVWLDNNGNGMRESNEAGLAGVIVRAIDMNGEEVGSTLTDESGAYTIDYLGKSTVYLEFSTPLGMSLVEPNVGADEAMDSDVDNSNGPNTTQFYNINPGIHTPNIDAGMTYSVLAIEWSDLIVSHQGTYNELQWEINSDVELSHFEIERSIGGINSFDSIGKVLATDVINQTQRHAFEDYDLDNADLFYYRIKHYDINGGFGYSRIVSVNTQSVSTQWVKLYPNPVANELFVDVEIEKPTTNLKIDIYDKVGRLIKNKIVSDSNLSAGSKSYNIKTSDLPNGVYNLKISIDNKVIIKRVIVARN